MPFEIEYVVVKEDEWCKDVAMEHHVHNNGMDELGGGLYSTVFGSKDSPFAVKIMRADDEGYLTYLETISGLGFDSPYLPKIYRAINYRMADDEYEDVSKAGRTTRDYFVFYIERLQAPRRYGRYNCEVKRPVDKFTKHLNRLVATAWEDHRFGTRQIEWEKLKPKHRDLIALLVIAREQADKYGHVEFDLHAGNIMKRGKQFVVTDPLA